MLCLYYILTRRRNPLSEMVVIGSPMFGLQFRGQTTESAAAVAENACWFEVLQAEG
jgi:hypothetical protein